MSAIFLPNDDNGDALRRIAADGSDLSRSMVIDFHLAVPSEQAAKQLATRCASMGLKTSAWKDDETDAWTCTCSKDMVPEHAAIAALETELDGLAKRVGGYADGWGSYGNAPRRPARPWWKFW